MKLKKLFPMILIMTVLLTFSCYAAGDVVTFSDKAEVGLSAADQAAMEDLLSDYAELRAVAFTGERTMMAGDSRFSELAAEEATRGKTIREKNISIGLDVLSAEATMRVDNASYDEQGFIKMDVYEWLSFDYDDMIDEQKTSDMSAIGVYHVMLVEPQTNKVVLDAYDEGPATGVVSSDFSSKFGDPLWVRQEKLSASAELPSEEEDDRNLMYVFYTGYNPDACVEYSDRYVYHGAAGGGNYESYYNSAYTNFNPYGGDCANFTSQSINAGGMPQVPCAIYGTAGWFYINSGNRSGSWTGAWQLRYYMKNNRGQVVDNPAHSQVYKGGPCFYDWAGVGGADNAYDHATICVGTNSAGRAIINSHNYDYYHYVFNYGGYVSHVQLTPTNNAMGFRSMIDEPVSGETYSGTEMDIRGWAINGKHMVSASYSINGGKAIALDFEYREDVAKVYPNYPTTNNGFTGKINLTTLQNGSHTVKVTAVDSDGNPHNIGSVTFNIEGNPTLTLTSPKEGTAIEGDTLTIAGSVSYPSGEVKSVTGSVDGIPVELTFDGTNLSGSMDISKLQKGTHSLRITAYLEGDVTFTFDKAFETATERKVPIPFNQMLLSGYNHKDTTYPHTGATGLAINYVNQYNIPYPKTGDGYLSLATSEYTGFITSDSDFAIPHTISFSLSDVAMDAGYTNGIYAAVYAQQDDFAAYNEGLWFEFSPTGVGVRINATDEATTNRSNFDNAKGHTGDLYKADFAGEKKIPVSIVNLGKQIDLYIDGVLAITLKAADGSDISEGDTIEIYTYETGSAVRYSSYVQPELTATVRRAAIYACGKIQSGKLYDYTISEGKMVSPLTFGDGISVTVDDNVVTAYLGTGASLKNIRLEKPMHVREILIDGESIANRLFDFEAGKTYALSIDGILYNLKVEENRAKTGTFLRNEGFTLYGNTTSMPAGWKIMSGSFATNGTYLYANDTVGGGHPCLYTTVVASKNHTFSVDLQNIANVPGNGTNATFLALRCLDNTNWATTMRGIWVKMNGDTFWLVENNGYKEGISPATVSGVDFNERFHTVQVFDDGATATLSVRTEDGAWTDVYRFTGLTNGGTSYSYTNLITGETGTIAVESAGIAAQDKGFYAVWRHGDDAEKNLTSELRVKNLTIDTDMGNYPRIQPELSDFALVDSVSGYSCVESWSVGELTYVNNETYKGMYYPMSVTLAPGFTMDEVALAAGVNIDAKAELITAGDDTFLIAYDATGTVTARYLLDITTQPLADTLPLRAAYNKAFLNPILNAAEINVTFKNRSEQAAEGSVYVAFYDADERLHSVKSKKLTVEGAGKENVDILLDMPEGAKTFKVLTFANDALAPMALAK